MKNKKIHRRKRQNTHKSDPRSSIRNYNNIENEQPTSKLKLGKRSSSHLVLNSQYEAEYNELNLTEENDIEFNSERL